MSSDELKPLEDRLLSEIADATDMAALEHVRVASLGKKGRVAELMQTLGKLPPEQRKAFGQSVNALKEK